MYLDISTDNSTLHNPTSTTHPPATSAIILKGYILITIACFGIIGNCLTLLVLKKTRKINLSVRLVLGSLGVADLCFLLFQCILHIFQYFILPNCSGSNCYERFKFYGLPIATFISVTAQSASIYVTLLIAVERFLAVTRPFHVKTLLTFSRIQIAIFVITIFSIFISLPHLLVFIYPELRILKQSTSDASTWSPAYTFMDIYATWIKTLIQVVFPLVASIYLNLVILIKVKQESKRRKSMSSQSSIVSESESNDRKSLEDNLTIMLLITVSVFSLCYLVKLICAILSIFRNEVEVQASTIKPGVEQTIMISYFCYFDSLCNSIVELFPTLNSSVNFIIYMLIGKLFRKEFLNIIVKSNLIL